MSASEPEPASTEPCAFCGAFIHEEPARCPVCEAPHHADCRACVRGCAALGCPGAMLHAVAPAPALALAHLGAALFILAAVAVAVILRPETIDPVSLLAAGGWLVAMLLAAWLVNRLLSGPRPDGPLVEPVPVTGRHVDLALAAGLTRLAGAWRSVGRSLGAVAVGTVPLAGALTVFNVLAVGRSVRGMWRVTAEGTGPFALVSIGLLVPLLLWHLQARRRAREAEVALVGLPPGDLPSPGIEFPALVRRLPLSLSERILVEAGMVGSVLGDIVSCACTVGLPLFIALEALLGPMPSMTFVRVLFFGAVSLYLPWPFAEIAGRRVAAAAAIDARLCGHHPGRAMVVAPLATEPVQKGFQRSHVVADLQFRAVRLVGASLLCVLVLIPLSVLGLGLVWGLFFGTWQALRQFDPVTFSAVADVVVQFYVAACAGAGLVGVVGCLDTGVLDLSRCSRLEVALLAAPVLAFAYVTFRDFADASSPMGAWLALVLPCVISLLWLGVIEFLRRRRPILGAD